MLQLLADFEEGISTVACLIITQKSFAQAECWRLSYVAIGILVRPCPLLKPLAETQKVEIYTFLL
jgi:hypothetical protein